MIDETCGKYLWREYTTSRNGGEFQELVMSGAVAW